MEKKINVDLYNLRYCHRNIQERYRMLIRNIDSNLRDLIKELKSYGAKIPQNKVKIQLRFGMGGISPSITAYSDSRKINPIYDDRGILRYIPELNDDSFIKIKFVGENIEVIKHKNGINRLMGISVSSCVIGNTIMCTCKHENIINNCNLDRRCLEILLMHPTIMMHALVGTKSIEIIETSDDIDADVKNLGNCSYNDVFEKRYI